MLLKRRTLRWEGVQIMGKDVFRDKKCAILMQSMINWRIQVTCKQLKEGYLRGVIEEVGRKCVIFTAIV